MTRIATQDLFDGDVWRGPATIEIEGGRIVAVQPGAATVGFPAVLPGLVDAAVSAVGYQEPPFDHPFAPETGFAALCLSHAVTTVVDVANTPAAIAHLGGLARSGRGPQVLAAHARLATTPSSRQDLVVDALTVARTIELQAAAGAALTSLGKVDRAVYELAVATAREHGQPVIHGHGPGLRLEPGDLLVPQLEAHARWSIEGLAEASEAALAAPFLPYHRHFQHAGSAIGRRMARSRLRRIYPDREPREPGDGVSVALAERRCLASSGAGAAGLVPGLSLWDELERFEALSAEQADVLHAATGAPARALRMSAGTVRPGAPADLMLLAAPARERPLQALRAAIAQVVVRGHIHDIHALTAHTDGLVRRALEAR